MNTQEQYYFLSHYTDNDELCDQLNSLTKNNWGITVLHGGEVDYVPFSMMYRGKVVANVCVGRFDLVINGEELSASMIQTVLTDEQHRNRGLIRQLFEPVKKHIANTTGCTFFTASNEKIEFYAKFGYRSVPLVDHCELNVPDFSGTAQILRKVSYADAPTRANLESVLANRSAVSNQFGFVNRHWLFHWFCHHFHQDNLYFIDELDVFLLLRIEDDSLVILDIVAEEMPTFQQLRPYLPVTEGKTVRTNFCPDRLAVKYKKVISREDSFFFDENFPLPNDCICLPDTQRG